MRSRTASRISSIVTSVKDHSFRAEGKQYLEAVKGAIEVIREKELLSEQEIKDLLDPAKLTNLDKSKYP